MCSNSCPLVCNRSSGRLQSLFTKTLKNRWKRPNKKRRWLKISENYRNFHHLRRNHRTKRNNASLRDTSVLRGGRIERKKEDRKVQKRTMKDLSSSKSSMIISSSSNSTRDSLLSNVTRLELGQKISKGKGAKNLLSSKRKNARAVDFWTYRLDNRSAKYKDTVSSRIYYL